MKIFILGSETKVNYFVWDLKVRRKRWSTLEVERKGYRRKNASIILAIIKVFISYPLHLQQLANVNIWFHIKDQYEYSFQQKKLEIQGVKRSSPESRYQYWYVKLEAFYYHHEDNDVLWVFFHTQYNRKSREIKEGGYWVLNPDTNTGMSRLKLKTLSSHYLFRTFLFSSGR